MAKQGTLKNWMVKAAPEDRIKLAELVGTSPEYLFGQLGNGHRQNPKLRLALMIVMAAERMHKATKQRLPLITLQGLAWPD